MVGLADWTVVKLRMVGLADWTVVKLLLVGLADWTVVKLLLVGFADWTVVLLWNDYCVILSVRFFFDDNADTLTCFVGRFGGAYCCLLSIFWRGQVVYFFHFFKTIILFAFYYSIILHKTNIIPK